MKFPKRALIAGIAITAIVTAVLFTNESFKNEFEENEEEEGLTIFEMMNLWGQMRAYPYDEIPQEKFDKAFKRMKSDEEKKFKDFSERMGASAMAAQTS